MVVKSILVDRHGRTIGASIINDDNTVVNLKTEDIRRAKMEKNLHFDNAIIDSNGFVRAKNGSFAKETIMQIQKKRQHNSNQDYVLMLKNVEVLKINRGNGAVDIFEEGLIPFDLYIESGINADRFNNRITFDWWCAHRILTLDREYSKELLNSCGLKQSNTDKDKADIALQYMCLSLKDFYWVKEVGTDCTWESVNLFDNSLSNAVVDIALKGKNLTITNRKLIDSDLTTDGVFPKAWYREKTTFYMYKGDKDDSVNKEVMASKLLQKLGFKVLNYDIAYFDGEIVAKSRCFTNKDTGYITAGDMNSNYDVDTSYKEYDIMQLCDYLVGNSDRHQDNWGYLFNDKRKVTEFAPIFDFNHAFEAGENFWCLPEQLFGRHITMLEIAREVVKKYSIKLSKLPDKDKYTQFVNNRIDLLYQSL